MRVKCLAQEHNTKTLVRLEPGPLDLESNVLTIRPILPSFLISPLPHPFFSLVHFIFTTTYISRHIDDKFSHSLGLDLEQNLNQFLQLRVMPGTDGVMQGRLAILKTKQTWQLYYRIVTPSFAGRGHRVDSWQFISRLQCMLVRYKFKAPIVSIEKFLFLIGSSHGYSLGNWSAITWVSNFGSL